MALLQALCPAVVALGAVRVAIGSGSLAAAAGTDAVRMASGFCPHPDEVHRSGRCRAEPVRDVIDSQTMRQAIVTVADEPGFSEETALRGSRSRLRC